jgi:hypothetical protein
MSLAALFTWLITAGGGLLLLTIGLIEYDREFQSAAATRLPVPVITAHALLAVAGLVAWAGYLITDAFRLAWAVAVTLAVVAILSASPWRLAGSGCTAGTTPRRRGRTQGSLDRRSGISRCPW